MSKHRLRLVLFIVPLLALILLIWPGKGDRKQQAQDAVLAPPTLPSEQSPPDFVYRDAQPTWDEAPAASAKLLTQPLIEWSQRYRSTSPEDQAKILDEGIALARERRGKLLDLIQSDPRAALLAALPKNFPVQMPSEITAHLETWISERAPLELMQACLHPEGVEHDHSEDFYRSTVIDGREYRVHVFGSRLTDASLRETSLHGIAIDNHLAVSDSRIWVYDESDALPGGVPPLPPGGVAIEANGEITVLASREEIPAFEQAILATEHNPIIVAADSGQGSSTVTGRPTQAWTHGNKKLLVIRVDFSDLAGTPINKFDGNKAITEDYVNNVINGTNGVRSFMQKNSFGKSDLILAPTVAGDSPDITQVFRMPATASSYATAGDNGKLHTDARTLATGAGYNLNNYDRIGVVFTYLGDLTGSQIDYGGLGNVTGSHFWINGAFDLRVVTHELGHNYGLNHSNYWKVTDGNPVSASGSSTEYGDPFDIMGGGNGISNHFSQWNKSLLQWIPDSAVDLAASSGTYRIYRFDDTAADLNLPRALKIVRDSTRDYWIGYRRATTSTHADNGATVIWGYNSNQQGNLLDLTTPGTNASDAPVAMNVTFNDSAGGISIKPVAQGGSGANEWMDVLITMQPRLQWEFSSYLVNEQGGSAVLRVTRSNNSSGAVSVNYSTASGTATSGSDFTSTSGTLNWANGDMTPKTITVPITADASVEGTETFTVTLSSPSGGVVVPPSATTVTIADPGSRDTTFASDFINSTVMSTLVQPDGRILIGGWFGVVQDSGFVSYNFGRVARLLPNGAIDTSFNPGTGANDVVYALARQPDGKVLIGGSFTDFNGTTRGRIARLNPNGSLDTSFASGAGANGTVYSILPLPNGKMLVGGGFTSFNGSACEYLVRLDAQGNVDTGFTGPDFQGSSGWSVRSLAMQPDGKCIVGGSFHLSSILPRKASLCRILDNGSVDTSFNGVTDGAHASGSTGSIRNVEEIAIQQDGKILIAGTFTAFNNTSRGGIARLSSTGALDSGFDPQANSSCTALMLLPDQSILIGGSFTTVGGSTATRIARLSSTGALDTNFAAAGGHAGDVQDFDLQANGNVVLGGAYASFQGASPSRPMWRLVPGMSGVPGVIQFATDAVVGVEGTNATINVTRTSGSLGKLTLGYSTVAGTATGGGTDFTTTAGNLTWNDGDSSTKTITIPITADSLADTPESFVLNLGEPQVGGVIMGERQQASFTILTGYESWAKSKFTQSELDNPLISGDSADPDGDGTANLIEYALGRNPKISDVSGNWSTSIQNVGGTKYLTITFRRLTSALDVSYAVQTQSQLNTLGWMNNAVMIGSATPNGDGTETVTYRDSVSSSSATKRFMRVRVTRTP